MITERGIKMKTVQTVLREADRDKLLDSLAYDMLYDTQLLLELKDKTVEQIQEACHNHMNAFIDHLLSLQAVSSDHMVLYMCEASSFDKAPQSVKLKCKIITGSPVKMDI